MHSALFQIVDDFGNRIMFTGRLVSQHFISSNTYGADDMHINAEVVDV